MYYQEKNSKTTHTFQYFDAKKLEFSRTSPQGMPRL